MKNVLIAILILVVLSSVASAAYTEKNINTAIQAAKSGSTVTLVKTTYTISNPIVLKSGVNLNGNGATLVLKQYVKWSEWTPVISGVLIKNVRVCNLNMDMNRDKQTAPRGNGYHIGMFFTTCTGVEVDHCNIKNGVGDGLRFKFSENVKIHDNTVTHIGHDCIFVVDCKYVDIYGNKVTTNTNAGLRDWNTVFLKMRSNTVNSELNGYGGYGGIQIEYSKYFSEPNVVISDNKLNTTWGPGILLIAYSNGVSLKKGILVSHNQFSSCGYSHSITDTGGISIQGLNGAIIQSNTADSCYNAFVYVAKGGTGTVISGNSIKNTKPHRIYVLGRGKNPVGSGYAISDVCGSKLVISGNVYSKNVNGNFYRCSGS